jgi:hypothetical protein
MRRLSELRQPYNDLCNLADDSIPRIPDVCSRHMSDLAQLLQQDCRLM